MALKTYPFDPADYIDTPESQVELLVDAFETEDPTYIANAIGIVARARGMSGVARQAGVTREGLYKAFNETGDPKLSTLLSTLQALGLKLSVKPADENEDAAA